MHRLNENRTAPATAQGTVAPPSGTPRHTCIVCGRRSARFFQKVETQTYRSCHACGAIFLHPDQRLSAEASFECYSRHRNDPDDPRYRQFLAQLADPLLERLPPNRLGLDFGCGPGPALACMLREAGHRVRLYDLYFHPDPEALARGYDFITCTETAEHFHRPREEFERFDRLLKPGGWLGLMTCFATDPERFANWHYRRDPTHVVFYRKRTLADIARRLAWHCVFPAANVVLMQKPDPAHDGR